MSAASVFGLCLWVLATIGYGGLYIFAYNRINATGFPRAIVKLLDKICLVFAILVPVAIAAAHFHWLHEAWLSGGWTVHDAWTAPAAVQVWLMLSLVAVIGLGVPWLRNRPGVGRHWLHVNKQTTRYRAIELLGASPARTWRSRSQATLPGNQLLHLAVEVKQLPVTGLPAALDGLKILHLSDLHLTGQIGPEFHALAAELGARHEPDVAMISGDLIDRACCIAWLETVVRPLQCPLGGYFVLGNHDRRIAQPDLIRAEMRRLGWIDLAGRSLQVSWRQTVVELLGSEVPWFGNSPEVTVPSAQFRLLLSHSPDQLPWARDHHVHLMLAGHTHGGQGRLPWLGPVLSPSWFGSRYASGEFYESPTTLHVSRGLSGTHPWRINCPPEVSVLELRASL